MISFHISYHHFTHIFYNISYHHFIYHVIISHSHLFLSYHIIIPYIISSFHISYNYFTHIFYHTSYHHFIYHIIIPSFHVISSYHHFTHLFAVPSQKERHQSKRVECSIFFSKKCCSKPMKLHYSHVTQWREIEIKLFDELAHIGTAHAQNWRIFSNGCNDPRFADVRLFCSFLMTFGNNYESVFVETTWLV